MNTSIRSRRIGSFRLRDILFTSLMGLLMLSDAMQTHLHSFFGYADIAAMLILGLWTGHRLICGDRGIRSRAELLYILLTLLFLTLGLISGAIFQYQPNREAVLIDALSCTRFAAAFLMARVIFNDRNRVLTQLELLVRLSRMLTGILFGAALLNLVVDSSMNAGERFGLPSFKFFYGHPTNLAATGAAIITLLATDLRRNHVHILGMLLVLALTFRFKAIGFAFVFALVILLIPRTRRRIPWGALLSLLTLSLVLAWDQILLYFGQTQTARNVLLKTSLRLANEHFPWGTGLGTFGTPASGTYYSDLYYVIGFDGVYGLMPGKSAYLSDSFWPIVFAEFGWVGTCVFLLSISALAVAASQELKRGGIALAAFAGIPLYLAIASSSEPAVFSTYAVLHAIVFALVLSSGRSSQTTDSITGPGLVVLRARGGLESE